jgi:hypothetical protein
MNEQIFFINLRWVGTKQIVVFYTKYTIEVFELKIQDLIDTLRLVKMSNMKSYYMYKYTEKPHQRGGGVVSNVCARHVSVYTFQIWAHSGLK